ncbi:T9SS type A sorting domain-containing protein [Taibaiella koreensis]|uniref:T9SS type A sorting domain-containing protein n=1 Tax=Taibaiella koreensis TaxID=1268548 RepID=UPI000E59C6B0|nr:T9SS type A sorting domain-containing protein [Taibaiella koreensis]
MKRAVLPAAIAALTTIFFTGISFAQGIIVNEISQGPAGAQEFIELLVVGSTTQATGTVDLRDWIIDDNNGDFQLAGGVAPGIANGHFRFALNDTLAAVPIGALIVIYNVADPNPAWTFRQLNGSGQDIMHIENGGYTYYMPGTSTLLRACSGTPNATSTSYAYTANTIPPLAANWTGQIGLANNGDAIQTRRPDGTFFHGFGFSTPAISNPFTVFPNFAEVGLPSFNGYTGTAANTVVYLDCGSYYYGSRFANATAANETPGAANTTDNTTLINSIRSGVFQYSLLGTDVSCQALPVSLLYFNGHLEEEKVQLHWATASETNNLQFTVQRSTDQKSWNDLCSLPGNGFSREKKTYRYTDATPMPGTSFYRLEQEDRDGAKTYSAVVAIQNNNADDAYLYPNPVTGSRCKLFVSASPLKLALYDITGKEIILKTALTGPGILDLDISFLRPGMYYMKLYYNNKVGTLPLVRN